MMLLRQVPVAGIQRLRRRRGGAMLELIVAMPLLVLLCIGVIDYGRVYFTSVAVSNAARAGAEWGITYPAFAYDGARQQSFAKLDGAEAGTITVTSSTVCRCAATTVSCGSTTICGSGYGEPRVFVTVTASKNVAMLLPYPGLPSTISIVRYATFRAQ